MKNTARDPTFEQISQNGFKLLKELVITATSTCSSQRAAAAVPTCIGGAGLQRVLQVRLVLAPFTQNKTLQHLWRGDGFCSDLEPRYKQETTALYIACLMAISLQQDELADRSSSERGERKRGARSPPRTPRQGIHTREAAARGNATKREAAGATNTARPVARPPRERCKAIVPYSFKPQPSAQVSPREPTSRGITSKVARDQAEQTGRSAGEGLGSEG
ncbi:hypothetical protein SRHO_G00116550 [Serrasalmus rhombeus]